MSDDETTMSSGMVQCCVCKHFFNAYKHQDPEGEQQAFTREDVLATRSRDLAADDLSASLEQSYVTYRPKAPWWSTLIWTILIIAVLLAALGQMAWFNREKLFLQAELKPHLERVCQRIDCQLQQKTDLGNIELLSRDVRSHPTHNNALLITATFINRAAFEQPYPDVGLVLSDLGGNVIAQRQFRPQEYLKEGYQEKVLMAKEVPITMIMEVRDPGQESVSFRFEFL
jgi:hypothetical protein